MKKGTVKEALCAVSSYLSPSLAGFISGCLASLLSLHSLQFSAVIFFPYWPYSPMRLFTAFLAPCGIPFIQFTFYMHRLPLRYFKPFSARLYGFCGSMKTSCHTYQRRVCRG